MPDSSGDIAVVLVADHRPPGVAPARHDSTVVPAGAGAGTPSGRANTRTGPPRRVPAIRAGRSGRAQAGGLFLATRSSPRGATGAARSWFQIAGSRAADGEPRQYARNPAAVTVPAARRGGPLGPRQLLEIHPAIAAVVLVDRHGAASLPYDRSEYHSSPGRENGVPCRRRWSRAPRKSNICHQDNEDRS
jgi:hypothetical protein